MVRSLLHRVAGARRDNLLKDSCLLGRFLTEQDKAAFEVLVRRHGPMVWGLCQRVLRHRQDAEDAFQATFLMLTRKAGSIGKRASLAGWLYQVAYRIALATKATASRRAVVEQNSIDLPAAAVPDSPSDAAARRELHAVLDEEVARLPQKYRAAVVLCYFEGKTYEEAARELDCPKGTLSIRLTRARALLRARLIRCGVIVSAFALSHALARDALPAGPSTLLLESAIRAGPSFAFGGATDSGAVSERAVQLMKGVAKTMLLAKLNWRC